MEIKLTPKEKRFINNPDDLYSIMQRILLRENRIDQEKEHLWIVGLNLAGYILYIELVSLGSMRGTIIEPMNVFRFAVMKNATQIIAVHNHPSGNMIPSEADKDITNRLIQVGNILDIRLEDHLIITPKSYVSFSAMGLMDTLRASIKYVPTYQVVEKIRKEEKAIAKSAIQAEREQRKKSEQEKDKILLSAINFLVDKQMTTEQIAKILEVTPKEIEKVLKKKPPAQD